MVHGPQTRISSVPDPCLFLADKDFSRYAPAKDIVGAFGGLALEPISDIQF
jgi:hypothetical protein